MRVNDGVPLAIVYAPLGRRAALTALFDLDERLADIVRTTTEPILGQMRLTWWYEALVALDAAPPPGEPVLGALSAAVIGRGVSGKDLAALVAAWETLLDPEPLDEARLEAYSSGRTHLFTIIATVLDVEPDDAVAAAGRGWALADLARHVGNADLRKRIMPIALSNLDAATARRWPRAGRPIGALALIARQQLQGTPPLMRLGRLLWHRITGF